MNVSFCSDPLLRLRYGIKSRKLNLFFCCMKIKLPKFKKSFYLIFSMFFLTWMLFIDANDVFTQFQLERQRKNLEDEKAYYLNKIEEVKKDREELLSNDALLEKFAREKYLMKKPTEDLFIVVEE